MQELVKEYREWRKAEGLTYNPHFVPKAYDGLPDLEHKYWLAEQKAQDFETQRDWKKAIEVKALPPAQPRRKPQRTVKLLKSGIEVRADGVVTGEDFNAFMDYFKAELLGVQKELNERLRWRGTWRSGEKFCVNDLVQDKGTIFVAVAQTEGRPGTEAGWRQLVKQDAKP
jgi:hypothetical protein